MALMCLSWFAFLRVGEAASIRVADIRGEKALGFWATKRGIIGRRWRRWSEWSRAWGEYLREYTKGWDGDELVVPGGPPVFESALARFLQGTEWEDGRWHGHRRGGGGGLRLCGRVGRRRVGFFRGGGGRTSVRPWPMPRTSRTRGCWGTSSSHGRGKGIRWSSGTWGRAKSGRGCSSLRRGWGAVTGAARKRLLIRMNLALGRELREHQG